MAVRRVNGTDLEVWRSPSDPAGAPDDRPVVIGLHGLVLDDLSGFYFTVGGTLAEIADVVLYDLRGHGRSEFVGTGYSVAAMVDDLWALLDELAITGPVHLVGNSYGGAIAVTASLQRPERVASIVMVEGHYPLQGWGAEMELTMAMANTDLRTERIMDEFGITSRRKAERMRTRADLLINHSTLCKELLEEPVVDDARLATIACPVLCLYGTESDLLERGRHLAGLLPAGRFQAFEGATHRLLTERTAELRPLVRGWVEEHAGLRRPGA